MHCLSASPLVPALHPTPYASHGCIHIPHNAMAFLYQWLPVGATVIVARN